MWPFRHRFAPSRLPRAGSVPAPHPLPRSATHYCGSRDARLPPFVPWAADLGILVVGVQTAAAPPTAYLDGVAWPAATSFSGPPRLPATGLAPKAAGVSPILFAEKGGGPTCWTPCRFAAPTRQGLRRHDASPFSAPAATSPAPELPSRIPQSTFPIRLGDRAPCFSLGSVAIPIVRACPPARCANV